jgi:alkanesulfonate monooxygenase SsuD/methylene tetrahydromethanopterin reductase-like flavin-dependent oxidoreductase (luciferase family)
MTLGIAIFPADFAIRPDELARAVDERGFESLFFTKHTHIPATSQTRKLMEEAHGGCCRTSPTTTTPSSP